MEPRTSTCPTSSTTDTALASPRRKNPPNPWVMLWIIQRQEKVCYSNLLVNLIHTDIPGYQNFVKMHPTFSDLTEERIHHHIKKSVTSFRKPLKLGLKLAIILRYLATGDTYTSLQYRWLAEPPSVSSSLLSAELQDEYLNCPTATEDWKKFRTRWNVPMLYGQ